MDAADATTAPSVLVLAEHTLFILDLWGHIMVQRRLDHHPSCFWPYPVSAGDASAAGGRAGSSGGRSPGAVTQTDNLLVATHSRALQVGSAGFRIRVVWATLKTLPNRVHTSARQPIRS